MERVTESRRRRWARLVSGAGLFVAAQAGCSARVDEAAGAHGQASARAAPLLTGSSIPTAHPRLWWDAQRLARGRSWYAANPFSPRAFTADEIEGRTATCSAEEATKAEERALKYVLAGDTTAADEAVKWLRNRNIRTDVAQSNEFRWCGQAAILVYDWCWDRIPAADRAALVTKWSSYVDAFNAKSWGSVGQEANNYFWGYFRNGLMWALASYHENDRAQSFLDHALGVRWSAAKAYFADPARGKGGLPHEGWSYGSYQLGYPVVPLTSSGLLGSDMWGETGFYKEALFALIYATTPGPTVGRATTAHEMFPFGDDGEFKNGGSARSQHLGAFAAQVVHRWPSSPLASYAQDWLGRVKPALPKIVAAVHASATVDPAHTLATLPLDYHAPGIGHFFVRSAGSPSATAVHLQLGRARGVHREATGEIGHEHRDWGTFQIWRGGRWLSRETTGYAQTIAGFGGVGAVDVGTPVGHNAILFEGRAVEALKDREGPPATLRSQSAADHAFAAVDLSKAYRSTDRSRPERDTPWAKTVVREFVFVRPLETLVVFDRLEAQDGAGVTAANVRKTFLLHLEVAPTAASGGTVVATNGDQTLMVTTLLPKTPLAYRTVAEGGAVGQQRVEITTSGEAQTHFLNVLQARGSAESDLQASVSDTGATFELTLTHPTKGSAKIVFAKGMTSAGGSVQVGAAAPVALPSDVQRIEVTEAGPVWCAPGTCS